MHKPGHAKGEETVSKTSPGPGWTKTPGTNIWAPPTGDKMMGKKEGKLMAKQSMKKVAKKGEAWPKVRRITDSKGRLIKH